ncbi:MAG TPA: CAP domain-containing protein [Bacillota bacterium]
MYLLLGSGCPSPKPTGEADPKQLLSPIEFQVFEKVNDYRISKNLPPLVLEERLIAPTRLHSSNMSNGIVAFSHEGFDQRVNQSGVTYVAAAENIAWNQGYADPAAQVVTGWVQSEVHRNNIEGDFNLTGVGVIQNDSGRYYYTQWFLKANNN